MSSSPDTVSITASNPSLKLKFSSSLRRLFGFVVPLTFSVYLLVGAVPGVLLPLQVAGIDEANKAANLALISGIGALVSTVMSPIAGVLSDRTRSRFGRRAPWMLAGAIATGLSLVGMGFANGIVQLAIAWTVVQFVLCLLISPLTAILPDRVPSAVRGLYSTLAGIGTMLGILAGQVFGASFAGNIQAAYLILPGVLIVVVALFVVVCPDTSSVSQPNEPFSLTLFLKTFWVSPRKHPDFFWGFLSRITLITGYNVIFGYQLYLLQDYIGLGDDAVGAIPLLGLVNLFAVLVSMGISGPLSDRIGKRKPLVIGAAVLMGLSMLIPIAWPSLGGMMVFTAVCSLGFGAYMAVDAALMSEVLPSNASYAKDLGVLNIAATLPQTLGPFLGGLIVLTLGYVALFPVGLALALLGAISIVPIKSVK